MYEAFYGLREKPFSILPDPEYLFFSKDHQDALSMLEYAVGESTGFAVLTGAIGSGKTTVLNHFLKQLGSGARVGLVTNTHVNFTQLMKMICLEFELEVRGKDIVEMVDSFYQFLLQQYAHRRKVILIIDEAQNLSIKVLDQIRMLSNYDAEKQCLVHIVLIGQPDLRQKLNQKPLEQFMQRVTMSHHLNRLDEGDVKLYIRHRLKIAGALRPDIFNEEAIAAVARYSKGVPRLINTLCEIGLVYGFAEELPVIGGDIIEGIIAERDATGFYSLDAVAEADVTPANIASAAEFLDNKIKSLDSRIDEIKTALVSTLNKPAVTHQPISEPPIAAPRPVTPLRPVQDIAAAPKSEAVAAAVVPPAIDEPVEIVQPRTLKFTRLFEKIGKEI